MAYDGNGSYSLPTPAYPAIPNEIILAEDRNEIDADMAAALSQVILKTGEGQMLAYLNFGTYGGYNITKFTASADGAELVGVWRGKTLPIGTADTQLATTAFVAAQAMAAALPGQAGHAGDYLTTDGTNATWTDPGDIVPDYLIQAQGVF